ncbi:hypothetical protein NKJ40_14760 [Mesorhizobium sp. M0119]|uniref:hypothetical protein n=1 Tax=unclassified Mesorhizobium TaxID=325217 RepID=UPI003338E093
MKPTTDGSRKAVPQRSLCPGLCAGVFLIAENSMPRPVLPLVSTMLLPAEIPDAGAALKKLEERRWREANPAVFMHKRIADMIEQFEKNLGLESELGLTVVGGQDSPIHLRSFACSPPDILEFHGVNERGQSVTLIQHHTQTSLLLTELPKIKAKAFRIGFVPAGDGGA